jgi:primosomal protein N' (replication factor Y)
MRVARVLPNVTGLDKSFDYLIPDDLPTPPGFGAVGVGTVVRVDLHGRRVGGWITAVLDAPSSGVAPEALKPIAKVTGHGPAGSLHELADWASVRWAARRSRPFLVAASPLRAITSLPPVHRTARRPSPSSPATRQLLAEGGGVLRLPPTTDVLPTVLSAVGHGPTLVVVPTISDAKLLTTRLRRAGVTVALMPGEWAAAAGGVDVVIGPRSAAWAPCPDMASALVLDEHDEALQEERAPTWHARDVVVERCRRANVPCVLVSPIPTLVAVETTAGPTGVVHPPASRERAGWPRLTIVDRTDEDPWKKSLVTSVLIDRIRNPSLSVICISNITGRARVLACRSCRALIRCERCDAAVGLSADNRLRCRRCDAERPPVCQQCAASSFANLRPGVTRLREELEAAAARPVIDVTATDTGIDTGIGAGIDDLDVARVFVGTEAALYRIPRADVVVFLEFDSEMLAPRFRAAEQALALIVRAGRRAPEVVVQTFSPDHVVLHAAATGDADIVIRSERGRRLMLGLPPYGSLASVSGTGSPEYVAQVAQIGEGSVQVGGDEATGYLVRSGDWFTLGTALNAAERPKGSRLRVQVDPPRI